ncbi:MAG: hypothetical protein JST09_18995 [Bacteroidetes bacterium]|nr:hypothetical protein [Bacteroidota bacterium]
MIKEEAIVQTLSGNRIGEIKDVQIQLPNDTKSIIGLEYGAIGFSGVPLPNPFREVGPEETDPSFIISANKVIGKLSLQSAGNESLFYQGNLIEDRNAYLNEGIATVLWQPAQWSHSRKREELAFNIESNASFIEGFFQDSWGKDEYESLSYSLHLYLWIEKCKA